MNRYVLFGAVAMLTLLPAGTQADVFGRGESGFRIADSEDSLLHYGVIPGRPPCATCGISAESCHFDHYDLWTNYCFEKRLHGQEHSPYRTWHPLRRLLDTVHFSIFPIRDCSCQACTTRRQLKGTPANCRLGLFGWCRHGLDAASSRIRPKQSDLKPWISTVDMAHSELIDSVGSRRDAVPIQEPDLPPLKETPSIVVSPEVPVDSSEAKAHADADKQEPQQQEPQQQERQQQERQQQERQRPVETSKPVIPRNTVPEPAKPQDQLHSARLVPAVPDSSRLSSFIETD